MNLLYRLRARAGVVVRVKLRRLARKFKAATKNCRETQQNVLEQLLALNADSQFSKDHNLNGSQSASQFSKRIPVTNYDRYRPYIEQLKVGNHSALLGPRNRLLMFCLSSGTTAESKFIPITQRFLEDYRRGWHVWGIHAFDDHFDSNHKNIVQITSDFDRFRAEGGAPCGNISGLATSMQGKLVRSMYSVPNTVSKISNPHDKYYTALRLGIADRNVGVVTTANPSTLIHLAQIAEQEKESLIRDISDGTLSAKIDLPSDVRSNLQRQIGKRNPRRARELEKVIEQTGEFLPQHYWPGIEFMAVWIGGSCAAYLDQLQHYYGDAPIRDHGLSASEGRMTIPLKDNCSEGVLDITSHYFEFIPEAEYGSAQPTILAAHELQEGQSYYILLTTSSGFYRYDICDVVQCVGHHETTPILKFLHKGAHISNITGEKISESQVVDAVKTSAHHIECDAPQFTVIPVWGDPPEYSLLVENKDITSQESRTQLVQQVDKRLQNLNIEYREKRESGRLAPMSYVPLSEGTWRKFANERQSRLGGSIEQYKHPFLLPDMELGSYLLKELAANQHSPSLNSLAGKAEIQSSHD